MIHTLTISEDLIQALDKLHINLTHFFLLTTATTELNKCSPIAEQTLSRKGWIKDGKLTESGRSLLESLKFTIKPLSNTMAQADIKGALRQQKRAKYKAESELFQKWWKAYPSTTSFADRNGKKWNNGRSLKVKMPECETKFMQWLEEGAEVDKMIEMVQFEYNKLKERTIAKDEDNMMWMPSTQRFLNKHSYADLLEQMEIEGQVGTNQNTTIDVNNLF